MNIHQQSSPLGDHKYRGDPLSCNPVNNVFTSEFEKFIVQELICIYKLKLETCNNIKTLDAENLKSKSTK